MLQPRQLARITNLVERYDYLFGLNFKTVVVLPNLVSQEKDGIAVYVCLVGCFNPQLCHKLVL